MAENVGVLRPRFKALYKDQVNELSFSMINYVRSLLDARMVNAMPRQDVQISTEGMNTTPRHDLQITTGEGGYPVLPMLPENDDGILKTSAEMVLRKFFNLHYGEGAYITAHHSS